MFGYSNMNQPNIELIANQISPLINRHLESLYSSNKIDGNQLSQLRLIIQENMSEYCKWIAMNYPNGIPQNIVGDLISSIINKAIQQYNARFTGGGFGGNMNTQMFGGSNSFGLYGNPSFNNTPNTGINTGGFNPSFNQNNTPPVNNNNTNPLDMIKDKDKKDIEIKKEKSAFNIVKKILDNKPITNKLDYQTIIRREQFKDEYNNKYIILEIDFHGGTYNNEFEFINNFVAINKQLCNKTNNWLYLIKYPEFVFTHQKFDKFKKQYEEVRKAVISNNILKEDSNGDIENIIEVLNQQSHEFVTFYQKLIIKDINEYLKRYIVTNNTIGEHFEIEEINDINELYEIQLTDYGNEISEHPKYKNMLTYVIYQSFCSHFDVHLSGVLDPSKDMHELIFCNEIPTIDDKTKQQFLKEYFTNNKIYSKMKNFSIAQKYKYVIITNDVKFITNDFVNSIRNGNVKLISDIQDPDSNYSSNLEYLLANLSPDKISNLFVITPNKKILAEFGIGKTLDDNVYIFDID